MNLTALLYSAILLWTAPTLNTDNSAVTPPLTYNVYQGAKGAVKTKVQNVSALTATVTNFTPGACFEVSTIDKDGDEGPHSPEVCAPSTPGNPNVKLTITWTVP